MPKYRVAVIVPATAYITVEADSQDSAEEKALEQASEICLCHYCSNELELDGEPKIIYVEK